MQITPGIGRCVEDNIHQKGKKSVRRETERLKNKETGGRLQESGRAGSSA